MQCKGIDQVKANVISLNLHTTRTTTTFYLYRFICKANKMRHGVVRIKDNCVATTVKHIKRINDKAKNQR